jgi:Ca2+-transporting ATPase
MVTHFAHACSEGSLLHSLLSSPAGLTNGEAERRLLDSGPNELRRAHGPSAITVLANQLRSVVVFLLLAAALISFALGERIEAVAIGAVLAINAAIGFITEWRARRAMASLLTLDALQAVVLRDGQLQRIAARLLVPGDVIDIRAGQHVPADRRILTATNAQVDEAALTGDSMPVEKHSGTLGESTPLADRANMAHKATTLMAA